MIVLVIMALAGVAMMKQAGSGLTIAGNVAFKQGALSAADLGTEAAIAWWKSKSEDELLSDLPTDGYYSDWGVVGDVRRAGDPTRYDWSVAKTVTTNDGLQHEVAYIIERMCMNKDEARTVAGQLCVVTPISDGADKTTRPIEYPGSLAGDRSRIHYRISTRVVGVKNTTAFIQVMIQ